MQSSVTIDVARAAREALERQIDRMQALEDDVRAPSRDPESLHDLRVASRRLRAALAVFVPVLRKGFRRPERELRHLTGTLGCAREWDVHKGLVEEARRAAAEPLEAAALDLVLARVEERRERERERALEALDGERLHRLERELLAAVPAEAGLPAFARFARRTVRASARRAWGRIAKYSGTKDPGRLHELRIAMKKLRYAVETLEGAFRGSGEGFAERVRSEAKKVQDALGRHRDRLLLASLLEAERDRLAHLHLVALASGLDAPIARSLESAERARRDFCGIVAGRSLADVLEDIDRSFESTSATSRARGAP